MRLSIDGVTLRYGVPGGSPRRSDVGPLASRAQSSGEWPGSSTTLRDGLAGLDECVGGGASVDVPGCRAALARLLGRARALAPALGDGMSDELFTLLSVGGRGGGGIRLVRAGGGGAMMGAVERVGKAGTVASVASLTRARAAAEAGGDEDALSRASKGTETRALGVVGDDGSSASPAASPSGSVPGSRSGPAAAGSAALVVGGCSICGLPRHIAIRVCMRGGGRKTSQMTDARTSERPSNAISGRMAGSVGYLLDVIMCWVGLG
jgi:hypothetical protein